MARQRKIWLYASNFHDARPSPRMGPLCATGAAQLANALRHFGHGNTWQKELFVMCLQPCTQGGGNKVFTPRYQDQYHAGVEQVAAIQNPYP